MRIVCGGEIGAIFFAFFGGGVCRGVPFWSGCGGGSDFLLAKIEFGTLVGRGNIKTGVK